MSFIDNLLIRIFAKQIGQDQFGNRYFEAKKQGDLNKIKRYVIYNGKVEASKVPPMWHAWLHYAIDELPDTKHRFVWQENFTPNLTGTKFARDVQTKRVVQLAYDKWQPLKSEVNK